MHLWMTSLRARPAPARRAQYEPLHVRRRSLDATTATAILGVDTLWGGDVLDPSGAGRFIADSWFSDEPLPVAYTHPAAARLREVRRRGRERRSTPPRWTPTSPQVDVPGAVRDLAARSRAMGGLRGAYLEGVAGQPRGHVGPRPGAAGARAGRAL